MHPKGHSAASSPRHLVLGKGRARWAAYAQQHHLRGTAEGPANGGDGVKVGDDGPPKLPPGHEQLYSVYKPALDAGLYKISVSQYVAPPEGDTKSKPLNLTSSKQFDVIAPRFWLPPADIHSVYPPQGHTDHARILPHVVFADEHLPWERKVSAQVESPERSRVPWLALLVFTQDELRLLPGELSGPGCIFPSDAAQSTTLSVNMTLNDIWAMAAKNSIVSPVIQNDPQEPVDATTASTKADFIFVTKDHIDALFRSYNGDGTRKSEATPNLVKYKYLAHVRNLNSEGMTDVGILDESGEAVDQLFSVVVAHRVGPWNAKSPATAVVHLVTLEGVEQRIDLASLPASPAKYVSLCSLYSWTYQCVPNDAINFYDAMVHLGQTYRQLGPVVRPGCFRSPLVDARLSDGFSLTRWRVKTGEITAAIFRGPLVPTKVARNPAGVQSTFSTDLQVLDRQLGLMDITYSLAWQLGKTMAIADQAFTAAVGRIRGIIHDQALQAIKAALMGSRLKTAGDVAARLERDVELLGSLHQSHHADPVRKWKRAPGPTLPGTGLLRGSFPDEAKKVAMQLASSLDAPPGQYWFYNEHNRPFSTDWAAMLKWILDRLYLAGLPAHYLITDPGFLPGESLRFFTIDANWLDAFVDGALSICCHLEKEDDDVRNAIKTTIEDFRKTVDPVLGYAPQIPTYGFLLRSAVVKMFPDLVVSAPPAPNSPAIRQKMAPILRQERIDEQVVLVLLDREPGDGLLCDLVISQPPHQQCFAAAANVGIDDDTKRMMVEVAYDQIYTTPDQPTGPDRQKKLTSTKFFDAPCPVFDWDSRMMIVENYANNVLATLQKLMSHDDFCDTVSSAALMGIQLNDPMYQLTFDLSKNNAAKVAALPAAAPRLGQRARDKTACRRPRAAQQQQPLSSGAGSAPQQGEGAVSTQEKAPAMTGSEPKPKPVEHPPAPPRGPAPHARLLGLPTGPEFFGPPPQPPRRPGMSPIPSIPGPSLGINCKMHGAKTPVGHLLTSTRYGVDIIFAVQVTGDVAWLNKNGFVFTGLFIYLPVFAPSGGGGSSNGSSPASGSGGARAGTPTPAPPPPPPPAGKFMAPYQGGGAQMQSNPRFNPLLVPSRPDLFCASLFPRTASGGVDLLTGAGPGADLTFVVGEVDVAPYPHPQPPLTVACMERYALRDDPAGWPVYVPSSFLVTLAPEDGAP